MAPGTTYVLRISAILPISQISYTNHLPDFVFDCFRFFGRFSSINLKRSRQRQGWEWFLNVRGVCMSMGSVTIEKVYDEVKALRGAVEAVREEIADRFLTPEEALLVEKALEERRRGKTVSLDELKKERGYKQ